MRCVPHFSSVQASWLTMPPFPQIRMAALLLGRRKNGAFAQRDEELAASTANRIKGGM
jgi:hypothetical protein